MSEKISYKETWIIYFIGIFFGIVLTVILLAIHDNEPSAMDVYRGETTLEITYRDSIPIDSTVVWKDKK